MIFVTNKNEFIHADRYNGDDYVFEPGQAIPLEEVAAQHMFGYGLADKSETLVRLGWATRYNEETKRTESDPGGVEKLKKFIFTKGSFVPSHDSAEPVPQQANLIDEDSPI